MRGLRIGIDAGGTFSDFVVVNESGAVFSFKIRSNPSDPAAVILEGLERAAAGAEAEVVHGSTVAVNALLERKGARTAFLCTEGFEDLIHPGRQRREQLYNLSPAVRTPLAPRELCFGVRGRVHFDGEIGKPLSAAQVKRLAAELRRAGVEAAAICLLHSYRNPRHERMVTEAPHGERFVCTSHEISPEYREYERATTAAVNTYEGPPMDNYLAKLERVRGGSSIPRSNGGSMPVAEARRFPVRTYGCANPEIAVDVVMLRVRAVSRRAKPSGGGSAGQLLGQAWTRRVFVGGRWRRTTVVERRSLGRRSRLTGPAIVVDYGATTLILPGWSCAVQSGGNARLKRIGRKP